MDGKGWKPEYGISPEGIEVLGFVEALPREARREVLAAVKLLCRRAGYLSLHDDLRAAVMAHARRRPRAAHRRSAKVIPLFRHRR
ncbi:MAG TPA: hypothetical protein VLW85_21440 [Myxococcales bacterium]|nr:hypothetical protein [Myxococcales bacterium]